MKRVALCFYITALLAFVGCSYKDDDVIFIIPNEFHGVIKLHESVDGVDVASSNGHTIFKFPSNGDLAVKSLAEFRAWKKWRAIYENGKELPVALGITPKESDNAFFSLGGWGEDEWFFVGRRGEWMDLQKSKSFLKK